MSTFSPSSEDESLPGHGVDPSPSLNHKVAATWVVKITSDRVVGASLCALSAAGFASLSILGKLAFQLNLNLVTILGWRFGLAGLVLMLFLKLVKRRQLFLGWRLTIPLLLLGSVGYAGQSSLFFASLERNPASITSLLLYIYPIFVALLSWRVRRVRPTRREVGAMFVAGAGVVLTISGGNSQVPLAGAIDPLGVLLVIGSAAWYAVYIITSDRYIHAAGPWVSTAWISLGAGGSFLLLGLITRSLKFVFTTNAVLILLGMVFLSTIMALGTFLAGMQRVGPTSASLLSTLEPVFTVMLAMLFLNEHLTYLQVLGGVLVLTAVTLLTLPGSSLERVDSRPQSS